MMNERDKLNVQDYLDDQLNEADRQAVELRLAESEEWRNYTESLVISRQIASKGPASVQLPEHVKSRLEQALKEEMAKNPISAAPPRKSRLIVFRHPIVSAAAMLVLLLGISLIFQQESSALPSVVSHVYKTCMNGMASFTFTPESPAVLEDYFAEHGLELEPSFTDLSDFGFDFQGGFIKEADTGDQGDLLILVFVNDREQMVTCQMFPGDLKKLTGRFTGRIQGGEDFLVAKDGDVTMTFWQEGPMVCVISSCINPDDAIRIAVGKATGMGKTIL